MSDPPRATACLSDRTGALAAEFVPSAGMLCCSLRHRGQELLAQNAGVGAYAERGKTMGIPLLYPWANRLAGFDYSVDGRAVTVPRDAMRIALDTNGLPIHGVIGSRLPWQLDGEPAPDARELIARVQWSAERPELFDVFPFRHDLEYRAVLLDDGLRIEVTVHACGQDSVPVAFGFHPYLSPPGASRERWLVELPPMRELALDAQQIPVGPERAQPARSFPLAALEFDDGFDEVADSARFAVADGERRIELELLDGYRCAQVYAPTGGRFICFEPMTAPANALCSGDGLRLLAPGERYSARFSVRIEDL